MRIALISLSTPTKENYRAASALPYHLIKGLADHNEIRIYSFNINEVSDSQRCSIENELNTSITFIPKPKWIKILFLLHLSFIRIILKLPLLSYMDLDNKSYGDIIKWNPEKIWIYGEELLPLTSKFNNKECIITMPDCESLYYYRLLSQTFATRNIWQIIRFSIAYSKYLNLERISCNQAIRYHFVGKEDANFFRKLSQNDNVFFINHPHYSISNKASHEFHSPKIKILIAGRYDIYMKEACDNSLKIFIDNINLIDNYQITFLGKGWEFWYHQFKACGYIVSYNTYVDNYVEEIINHDIQLTPISVGTGTKGKVLDALANGLLVIGTPYALENIAVKNGESCFIYSDSNQLLNLLLAIPNNRVHFEEIAKNGKKDVTSNHGIGSVSSQFQKLMFK